MPTKPSFDMRIKGSDKTVPIKYTRLLYTRGHRAHIFALHREHHAAIARKDKEWIVSDPVSGYRLLRVNAHHKGMPISSADLTLAQARQCALADIDALVDRVGLDQFEAVIDRAHARATETTTEAQ
mgnify:CR=1 FL=1|tara:strand:- start:220 stop:597 length:378 start_codon:yes stop_codon:yes gene_type:complete